MPRKATTSDTGALLESVATDTAPVRRVRRVAPRKREVDEDAGEINVPASSEEKRPIRRKAPARKVSAAAPEVLSSPVISSPTTSSAKQPSRIRRNRGVTIVVILLLLVGVGASAVLGVSDRGEIDVMARMNEQLKIQAKIAGEKGETSYTIPVQNSQVVDVPNGGLRGRGVGSESTPPPPPPAEAASSTTTTTDTTVGSSTESADTVEDQTTTPTEESTDTVTSS